jgi:hypothetical protein
MYGSSSDSKTRRATPEDGGVSGCSGDEAGAVVVGVAADSFASGVPPEVSPPSQVPAVEPTGVVAPPEATPSAELEGRLAPGADPVAEFESAGTVDGGASPAAGGAEDPAAAAIGAAGAADPCAVGSDGEGVVGALGADPTQAATPRQAPSSVAKGAAIGARIMGLSIFPPRAPKQVAPRSKRTKKR